MQKIKDYTVAFIFSVAVMIVVCSVCSTVYRLASGEIAIKVPVIPG